MHLFLALAIDQEFRLLDGLKHHEGRTQYFSAGGLMPVDTTAGEAVDQCQAEPILKGRGDERLNVRREIGAQDLVLGEAMLVDDRRRTIQGPSVMAFGQYPLPFAAAYPANCGMSSQVLPWSRRPFSFFERFLPSAPQPPHCLKKNATPASSH